MAYNKTIWENLPSTNTPINKDNLNKIENQLESSQNEIDNIIESGSNANGNYIKYSDGTMICYAKFTANFSLDIAYNAVYRGDLQTVNFPETFIDNTYSVNIQGIAPVHLGYIGGRTKDNFTFYPIAFVSREAGIKEITYVAIGKWK